ncbi:MAG: hypothetical protein CMC35_04620 [Flavobacteriaceae bacterium]|nr:hypothetical protein [Flavobacteriaceae bacterium]|tara:strand:+ start:4955 stop:5416 length:462 start_codon:yes stop_codon:yes gene_type:complete
MISGVFLSFLLIATPFLFYIYKYAPTDSKEWNTIVGTINAGNFAHAQSYMHALFTKVTFVLMTGIWFLTSKNWWKYAILVPLTMFLFQLAGVINHKNDYIDEFDFWYSLPIILPILIFLIYISYQIGKRSESNTMDLKDQVDDEISKIFSDKL